MNVAGRRRYSFRDYVRLADAANVRLEFLDGDIYAMAGGTPEHAALANQVAASLTVQLRGRPCRVHSSDLRVRVRATGLATYPDVAVVCGKVELHPEDKNTVQNPVVLVEVLSPSTEDYDRTEKLEHYRELDSLAAIVFVAHDRAEIAVHERDARGPWRLSTAREGERLEILSLGCALDVDEIYRDPLGTTLARND